MWFKQKTSKDVEDDLERYFKSCKRKIDEELEIYKKQAELEKMRVDLEVSKARLDTEIFGARQTAKYEHEFHSGMEAKRAELAKLDALIESKKEILDNYTETVKDKNSMISSLMSLCAVLSRAPEGQIGFSKKDYT